MNSKELGNHILRLGEKGYADREEGFRVSDQVKELIDRHVADNTPKLGVGNGTPSGDKSEMTIERHNYKDRIVIELAEREFDLIAYLIERCHHDMKDKMKEPLSSKINEVVQAFIKQESINNNQ